MSRTELIGLFVALYSLPTSVGEEVPSAETASAVAQPARRPAGAPRYSDVSMRLFRKHKNGAEIATGKAFHITRADWSYIKDPAYIEKIHARGWTFQGSVNAVTHNADHAMRDKKGTPVLDHFNKPGRYWADNDNESYRRWYLEQMAGWVRAGADSIQRDEPTTCRRTPIPDAARFFRAIHPRFEKMVGRRVPLSCNLAWNGSVFGGKGEPVAALFDFGMAEMGPDKVRPDFFRQASRDARRRGTALIYTAHRNMTVSDYRRAIAGCYATGMQFIVPWDQYAGVGNPRVFSRPEDLADLYGFVRANARLLDGCEDAAAVGWRLSDDRWKNRDILAIRGAERVAAFVRARPDAAAAPVVVHLVDWGKPKPFTVALHPRAFFTEGRLAVELRTPPPYDDAAHRRAEEARDYAPLSTSRALMVDREKGRAIVAIPTLKPWGILVVSPKRPSENTATSP